MKHSIQLILALALLVPALDLQSGRSLGAALSQQPPCQTFPETGKAVCGTFLAYWQQHGGLAQQGYPISGQFVEVSDVNGKSYTVQYFERAVFELHPENAPPFDVLLSLLGSISLRQRYPNGAPATRDTLTYPSRFFPETGKQAWGQFFTYWQEHGGLAQQGYPISGRFIEKSAMDSKEYTVQYFERAVFELHLENPPPYRVLLSQLGTFQFKRKYPTGEPGVDVWATLRARPLNLPALPPGEPCPAAQGKIVNPAFGLALGEGPVYPVGFGTDGAYYYGGTIQEGGWYLLKVLWVSSAEYDGPALVRGHQIDGPNEMRFERGADPPTELQLDPRNSIGSSGGWNNWPTYTRLRSPGCYAYQVDGTGFTHVIVFNAVDTPPPPPGPGLQN